MIIDQISYADKQDEINNWLNIIFEIDKKIKEYNEVINEPKSSEKINHWKATKTMIII